jgi:phosphoribosylamine--glycine ligase
MAGAEVLIIGSGGREHALEQAMYCSPDVSRVVVEPDLQKGLAEFSGSIIKPFVVIGPEAPLVDGMADELREREYTVFGPSADAAQFEADKILTTRMAQENNIIHPASTIIEGDNMLARAMEFVNFNHPSKYVIKARGLTGGKGVVLPDTFQDAREAVMGMLDGSLYSGGGSEGLLFQERHHGPELSAMAVIGRDKDNMVILPLAQDHKRLLDNDLGDNTGGMGAYSPVPSSIFSPEEHAVMREKLYASVDSMANMGRPYNRGVLYGGLMKSMDQRLRAMLETVLIEFNVRFGDPESQAILPPMTKAGVDVYRLLYSAALGELEVPEGIDFANIGYAALSVCLAAENYGIKNAKVVDGDIINGLDREYPGVTVQLAGVSGEKDNKDSHNKFTSSGRVLYVTGVGENIDEAAANAYAAIGDNGINFRGMQYRTDIGWQARTAA